MSDQKIQQNQTPDKQKPAEEALSILNQISDSLLNKKPDSKFFQSHDMINRSLTMSKQQILELDQKEDTFSDGNGQGMQLEQIKEKAGKILIDGMKGRNSDVTSGVRRNTDLSAASRSMDKGIKQQMSMESGRSLESELERDDNFSLDSNGIEELFEIYSDIGQAQNQELKRRQVQDEPQNSAYTCELQHVPATDKQNFTIERLSFENKLIYINHVLNKIRASHKKRGVSKLQDKIRGLIEQGSLLPSRRGVTATQDSKIIDSFFDVHNETLAEIRLKRLVGDAIMMDPIQRSQANLDHLNQYFQRFRFFIDLKKDNKGDVYFNVLRYLKLLKLNAGKTLIEQGEEGDRYYFILKGEVKIKRAYTIHVKEVELTDGEIRSATDLKIQSYLHAIYSNFNKVFWSKVPYMMEIKAVVNAHKLKFKESLERIREAELAGSQIEMDSTLHQKLRKISKVFDFKILILHKEVDILGAGSQIGELALLNNEVRQATVEAKDTILFAFLEKEEFRAVLDRAQRRDIDKKTKFLQTNRFFKDISNAKLNKMYINMRHIQIARNQTLYNEGEQVKGIYMVQSGTLRLVKKVTFEEPISAKTKNKWFVQNAIGIGANKKKLSREVAEFNQGAFLGFEEIFRDFILSYKDQKVGQIKTNSQGVPILKRDFSCYCASHSAEILYLPFSIILPILKLQDKSLIERLFKERRQIIQVALDNIGQTSNSIAGSSLPSKSQVQQQEIDDGTLILEPQSIEAGLSARNKIDGKVQKMSTNQWPSTRSPSQHFEVTIGNEINSYQNHQNLANMSLDAGSSIKDQRNRQILLQQNNSQTLVNDGSPDPELTHETLFVDQPTNDEVDQQDLGRLSLNFEKTQNSIQLPLTKPGGVKHLGTEYTSLGRESNQSQGITIGQSQGLNTSRKRELMSTFLDANLSRGGSQASDKMQSPSQQQKLKSQFPPTQTQRHQFNIKKAQRMFQRQQSEETQNNTSRERGVNLQSREIVDTKLEFNFEADMKSQQKDFQIAPGAKSHKGTGHSRHAVFKTNTAYHGANLSLPFLSTQGGVNQSQDVMKMGNYMKTDGNLEKDPVLRNHAKNLAAQNKRPFQSNNAPHFGINLISGESSGRESFPRRTVQRPLDQFRTSEQFNPQVTQSIAFSSMAANHDFGRTQQRNQSNSSMSKIQSPQDYRNPHQLFSQGGERKLEKRQVAHHNLLSSQRKHRDSKILESLRTEQLSQIQGLKKDNDEKLIQIKGDDSAELNHQPDVLPIKSQADPFFVFAQDLCQDNIIDEQSILEKQSLRTRGVSQNLTPLFNGYQNSQILPTSPIQPIQQPVKNMTQASVLSTEDEIDHAKKFVNELVMNGDTTHLYLKDVKNFLNLRNAAFNCNQRKDLENSRKQEELAKKKGNNPKAGVVATSKGSKIQKIVYEGEKDMASGDIVGKEMSLRLLGVMQSLDTAQYYQMIEDKTTGRMLKETDAEAVTRIHKSMDKSMESIQHTFSQMDHFERVQNYKRKTKANIIESPKKSLRSNIKKDGNSVAKVPIHFQGFKPTLKPIANERQPVVPVGIFTSKNPSYKQQKPVMKNFSEKKQQQTTKLKIMPRPRIEENDSISQVSNTQEKFRINVNKINNLMDQVQKFDSQSQGSGQETVQEEVNSQVELGSQPRFKDTPCAFDQDPVDNGADSQRPSPDRNIGVIFEETEKTVQHTVENTMDVKDNIVLITTDKQRQELKNSSQLSLAAYNIQQMNLTNRTPMENRYGSREALKSDQDGNTNTVSSQLRNRESSLEKQQAFSDISIKPRKQQDGKSSVEKSQLNSSVVDLNKDGERNQDKYQKIQAFEVKIESPISINYSKGNIGSQRSNLMKLQNIQLVQQQLLFGSGQNQYIVKDKSSQFIQVKSPEINISSAQAESIRYGGRQAESTSKQNSGPGQSYKYGIQLSNQNLTAKNKIKLFEQLKNQTTTVQNLSQVRQTQLPKIVESPSKVIQQTLLKKHQSVIKVPNYYGMKRQNLNINEIITGTNDFPLQGYAKSPEKSSVMGQTDKHANSSGMQTIRNSQKPSMRNSNLN